MPASLRSRRSGGAVCSWPAYPPCCCHPAGPPGCPPARTGCGDNDGRSQGPTGRNVQKKRQILAIEVFIEEEIKLVLLV